MATRIEKILNSVRITLADKDNERWDDSDLLDILNEGHKDLCRHTQILKGRVEITLTIGDPFFTLPDDVWMITRISYEDRKLPLISYDELDSQFLSRFNIDFGLDSGSYAWESETGKPLAILYDRRNLSECRVYPIPDDSISDTSYAFVHPDDRPVEFAGDELFGTIVDILDNNNGGGNDYTFNSVYGFTTDLYDPQIKSERFQSDFGVVTSINEVNATLLVYYIKNPLDLVDVNSDLETPSMFDTALKYYVCGHAFMNDLNEEYQAKGRQQLGFYDRELGIAEKTNVRDGTRAAQHETTYRGAF